MPRLRKAAGAKARRNDGKRADGAGSGASDDGSDGGGPKQPRAASPYVYARVPFGFPPWYLDGRAEAAAAAWAKLADRHRAMSARARNMSLAVASVRGMGRPVGPGDAPDARFLGGKLADAALALKGFSDIRRGSPATITDRPLQLLNYAEDCLWMALTCLCGMLEARPPNDLDGPDGEWEERLGRLLRTAAA